MYGSDAHNSFGFVCRVNLSVVSELLHAFTNYYVFGNSRAIQSTAVC